MKFYNFLRSPDAGNNGGGGNPDAGGGSANDNDGDDPQPNNGNGEGRRREPNSQNESFSHNYVRELRGEAKGLRNRLQEAETNLANLTRERDELRAQNETLTPYKEKYTTIEQARKTELLERLPEDIRKDYEGFTLEQLEIVAKHQGASGSFNPGANRGGGNGSNLEPTSIEQLSIEQQQELAVTNPTLLQKLLRKKRLGQK